MSFSSCCGFHQHRRKGARYVDQIAFDSGNGRIYCASGTGFISVLQETRRGVTAVGNVAVPKGAHTIAVDPKTHAVWICYGSDTDSHLLRLNVPE